MIDIDQDLNHTIDIIDTSDDGSENVVDNTIDDVADAIDDVKYGDSDDEDDAIEQMEGIPVEDIKVDAGTEKDAAEIELMNEDDEVINSMTEDSDIVSESIIQAYADVEDMDMEEDEEDFKYDF